MQASGNDETTRSGFSRCDTASSVSCNGAMLAFLLFLGRFVFLFDLWRAVHGIVQGYRLEQARVARLPRCRDSDGSDATVSHDDTPLEKEKAASRIFFRFIST